MSEVHFLATLSYLYILLHYKRTFLQKKQAHQKHEYKRQQTRKSNSEYTAFIAVSVKILDLPLKEPRQEEISDLEQERHSNDSVENNVYFIQSLWIKLLLNKKMLHDQSLEELIRAKLNEKVQNPLEYVNYQFETEEWSNIPSLVPQYILHLNNHLRALIGHCKMRSLEETTLDLRQDVFNNFKKRDSDLNEIMDINQNEHNEIQLRCDNLNKLILQTQDQFVWLKQLQVNQVNENLSKYFESSSIDFESEFDSGDTNGFYCEKEYHQEPRAFSILQLRTLISFALTKSMTNKRIQCAEIDMKDLQKTVEELHDWKKEIEQRMYYKFQEVNENIDSIRKANKKSEDDQGKRNHDILEKIKECNIKIQKNKDLHDENLIFQEMINSRCDELLEKIQKNRDIQKKAMSDQSHKFELKIAEAMTEMNQNFSSTRKEIDRNKQDIHDLFEMKHDNLTQHVENEVHAITQLSESTLNEVKSFREELTKKNKHRITKMKDVCSGFFEKTEKMVNRSSKSVEEIEKTFENWKMNVMKPAQLAEARLFSIEAQLFENESERMAEFQFTKEIIKKFVFAVETQFAKYNHDTSLSYTASPGTLLNVSTQDDIDGLPNSSITPNQHSTNHSKTELPSVLLQQAKFSFGNPNDQLNDGMKVTNLFNRKYSHSRKNNNRTLNDASLHINTERNNTGGGGYSVFKQRLQLIRQALEQDSELVPQYKHRVPLKHQQPYKINYTQEKSINDSQFDKQLLDNTSPSVISDNVPHESLTVDLIDKPQRSVSKPMKSKMNTGKISPGNNNKINSLLSNYGSHKKPINAFNQFLIKNNPNNNSNVVTTEVTESYPETLALDYTFTHKSQLKTLSIAEQNKLAPIYHHVDQIDAILRDKQLQLEKELSEKRVHKRAKLRSENKDYPGVNLDPIINVRKQQNQQQLNTIL
ncbi:UNKNOWN [Stylonychia lemnae]|uniref:Uncharacterized protein n=1 Tax=Stylonychia lemnae TaxID=5949 RepID=A0A078APM8_STYLE|nr:UNKNOWN [Stylonychia lemnae]|eukprot:CDW84109.1 UNKNOWN [Stylonychia lemnae]